MHGQLKQGSLHIGSVQFFDPSKEEDDTLSNAIIRGDTALDLNIVDLFNGGVVIKILDRCKVDVVFERRLFRQLTVLQAVRERETLFKCVWSLAWMSET